MKNAIHIKLYCYLAKVIYIFGTKQCTKLGNNFINRRFENKERKIYIEMLLIQRRGCNNELRINQFKFERNSITFLRSVYNLINVANAVVHNMARDIAVRCEYIVTIQHNISNYLSIINKNIISNKCRWLYNVCLDFWVCYFGLKMCYKYFNIVFWCWKQLESHVPFSVFE